MGAKSFLFGNTLVVEGSKIISDRFASVSNLFFTLEFQDISVPGANCTADPDICVANQPLLAGDGM